MMDKLTIPVDAIHSVAPFMAKQDIRWYLNYVHLRADGTLEATDGHTMAVYRAGLQGVEKPLLFRAPFKVPKATLYCELDGRVLRYLGKNGLLREELVDYCPESEYKYPDTERVLKQHKPNATVEVGVAAALWLSVHAAVKHCGFTGVRLVLNGADGAMSITHPSMPQWQAVLMPCRL